MISIAYLIAAAASAPVATAPAPQATQQSAPAKKDKKICRRDVSTGSIMPRSVCRTKADWDRLADKSQTDKDKYNEMERSRSLVGLGTN